MGYRIDMRMIDKMAYHMAYPMEYAYTCRLGASQYDTKCRHYSMPYGAQYDNVDTTPQYDNVDTTPCHMGWLRLVGSIKS